MPVFCNVAVRFNVWPPRNGGPPSFHAVERLACVLTATIHLVQHGDRGVPCLSVGSSQEISAVNMIQACQHGIHAVLHRLRVDKNVANTTPEMQMDPDTKSRNEAVLELRDYTASPQ